MSDIKQDVLNIMNESDTDKNLPDEVSDELSAIVKSINEESDSNKLKDLLKLFNLAMLKKEINRAEKQSDVLDYALSEVENRLLSGDVSDKSLPTYIKVLQDNINNVRNITSEDRIVPIQIKQEININSGDSLSRESREKIQAVIDEILTNYQNSDNIVDAVDIQSDDERTDEDDD